MAQITLSLPVTVPDHVTQEDLLRTLRMLLDVGVADAQETLDLAEDDGADGDSPELLAARIATELEFGEIAVATTPRVLVVVSGGIADPVYDSGVDVEVFDWDNYNDADYKDKTGVPAHFADLAEPVDIPVAY